jgi:hypothetical protein
MCLIYLLAPLVCLLGFTAYCVALYLVFSLKLAAFPAIGNYFFEDRSRVFNESVLTELLGEAVPQLSFMIRYLVSPLFSLSFFRFALN